MQKVDTLDTESALVFLPGVKLFFNLDNTIISQMAQRMSLLSFDAGECMIREGESGRYMLLIRQGRARVRLDEQEVELGKGEIIGEMSLLSGKPSKANVTAMTPVEALALYRDDFQALMAEHRALAAVMTGLMKSRMFGPHGINRVGKYRILNKLGEGGMSVVYNAIDTVLGREVAIKMLKYEIASKPDFKQRFRQEAITIANLKHPNILHVIESIEDYSTEFIVMEKLDGYDLKYYLKHQGVFDADQTCNIIGQVAMALEYAGNQRNGGIIHRDIKLANIVLDEWSHVKLTDFGIAITSGRVTDSFEGTLSYMAPEILQRKPYDYRIDIYALGITAYAMLTGKPPFRAPDIETLIARQIADKPPDIEKKVPDIPRGLAEFIHRALEKNPDERISSWSEILALLSSCRTGSEDLLAGSDMDMAVIVRFKTKAINTELLLREIEQVLKMHHASYEMETVMKEKADVDITL